MHLKNKFVNSDGQWLFVILQNPEYKLVLCFKGQCAAKQPLTKKAKKSKIL